MTIPDMNGLARPIDGNGDGSAILDRGALEYARQPPTRQRGGQRDAAASSAAYRASRAQGTDPDDDPLTYAWVFDDGATATGAMVNHQFATLGFHTATVTATDPTGSRARRPPRRRNDQSRPAPGPAASPPPPDDDAADDAARAEPRLKLAQREARPQHAEDREEEAKAKTPKGTTIRFTLSEPATVTFAFDAGAPGRPGRAASASGKSSKHRHGRPCTLLELKGTIIRRNLAAGLRSDRVLRAASAPSR